MTTMLDITCRDPVVARDGRPFGAGQGKRMRSLDWPLPSVLAGSLRTTLGKAAQRAFSVETAQDLLEVEVAGPLPRADGQLYLPAPEDCVVHPDGRLLRAAPRSNDEGGCDWPTAGLLPVEVPGTEDFKPEEAPAWWPLKSYAAWLAREIIAFDGQFLRAAEKEERTHATIDPAFGASEDSQLFTTAALALSHLPRYRARGDADPSRVANGAPRQQNYVPITLSARIRAGGWCKEAAAKLDALHPFGGERRLAHWQASADGDGWKCPPNIRAVLAQSLEQRTQVRMVLATPAVFKDGWKPGWLDDGLVGSPPGADLVMRLVGVSIQRWKAVSGWSLAELPRQPRGPKPVKRMVPAGGVYFFEVVDGKASGLGDRWLESVSDDEQDRRDGFGLAAWGIW